MELILMLGNRFLFGSRFRSMDPCFDLYILEKKNIFRRKRFKRFFFCRVTKNESNEIIIFWIESIISNSAPEITWKT